MRYAHEPVLFLAYLDHTTPAASERAEPLLTRVTISDQRRVSRSGDVVTRQDQHRGLPAGW